jgi:fucose permease
MFILAAVILGTEWAFLYPSIFIEAIDHSGSAQGPAMATFTALADLGAGMGPMIMGAVLQWTNFLIMFFCLTLTGVTNLLYFYFVIGKRGKEEG